MSTVGLSTSTRSRTRSKGAICFEVDRGDGRERIKLRQDIDPSFTDSIEVDVDPDARSYDDALPDLPLPASGEELADCGDDAPVLFCPDCGSPERVGRTCRRSRCPRCWQAWDFHQARTIAEKCDGLRRYKYASGNQKVKLHHLTVSFPPSTRFNSGDPIGRAADAVKRLLEHVGVETGYLIYHPYRIAKEHRGEVMGHESGDGDLTWKDVIGRIETNGWDEVRDEYLIDAPHFHVVCLSNFVQGGAVTDEIEDNTGVVIHRITKPIGDGKEASIYDLEDLCSVTAYSLSHAGLSADTADDSWQSVVRAFGEVANFDPSPGVAADVDETLREVAPTVLGVEFSKPRCSSELDDESDADADDVDEHGRTHRSPRDRAATPLEDVWSSDVAPGQGRSAGSSSATVRPPSGSTSRGGDGLGPDRDEWGSTANTGFINDESSSWDAPAGHVPSFVEDPSTSSSAADRRERCGARLAPMRVAPKYLEDDEWTDDRDAETIAELRDAYAEYVDLDQPEPADIPPPEDGPPPD